MTAYTMLVLECDPAPVLTQVCLPAEELGVGRGGAAPMDIVDAENL